MVQSILFPQLPTPDSLLPTPDSRLPTPYSLFPIPYSRLPTPYSLIDYRYIISGLPKIKAARSLAGLLSMTSLVWSEK
ncbi:MAG: hypothetical protein F6J94_27925 [Moorea sp. SIO1F2]|uniref:hypothetical protein n=1 Tax=Moorena sp. SIO1F2 TaxID=2607819 RepID=UPI0013B724E4|nr:hypothetical protein [Moorena sp. SIO1F2]NET85586.1 hypothetical protein [Moorena sp. SIO1F2]